MAASAPLIERTDIHKSCKSLESVVNLFNDYCQVSDSLAIIQRKLAKALKEASSLKATNHIAGVYPTDSNLLFNKYRITKLH